MQGTLDLKDPNMGGVLAIYDLAVVVTHLIEKMSDKAQEGEAPARPKIPTAGQPLAGSDQGFDGVCRCGLGLVELECECKWPLLPGQCAALTMPARLKRNGGCARRWG